MKRLIYILLAFTALLTAACSQTIVFDDINEVVPPVSTTIQDNQIWYTTTNAKVVSTIMSGVVSNTYENGKGIITFDRPIDVITVDAFYNCAELKSVQLPQTVMAIEETAFGQCTSLSSIKLSNELRNIGPQAFSGCKALASITIPDSVEQIEQRTFCDCTALKSVTFGATSRDASSSNLRIIGQCAFQNCTSLVNITLPSKLEIIAEDAFTNCISLISITIPQSVNHVENNVFIGCSSLKEFNGKFATSDSRSLVRDRELIAFAPASLTEYTIDSDVVAIVGHVFSGCNRLQTVNIPSSVESVDEFSFWECSALKSITLPENVRFIGGSAFWQCTNLASVYCKSITPPELGNDGVFDDNKSGRKIYVPTIAVEEYKRAQHWSEYASAIEADPSAGDPANSKILYTSTDGNVVTPYAADVFGATLLSNTYSDGQGVMTFNGNVTKIGNKAFEHCGTLATITIPESVTELGSGAFNWCDGLQSVNIPEGVTALGDNPFCDCNNLSSFSGKYATSDGRCLVMNGTLVSFAYAGITKYTIPSGVTAIGAKAFCHAAQMTQITIPQGVKSIGKEAFTDCYALTSVSVPSSVTTISEKAFYYCGFKTLTLSEGLQTIGESAFEYNSNLSSVTIPQSVTSLAERAFVRCPSLASFSGRYASEDGKYLIVNGTVNSFAPAGIATYSFPEGVTQIGALVFFEAKEIKNLTIPQSVTAIGAQAFQMCKSLTSLHCKAVTPPTLADTYVFDNNSTERMIYVPEASVAAYKSAPNWSEYASSIMAESGEISTNHLIFYTSTDGNVVTPYAADVFGANIVSNTYAGDQGIITFDGDITKIGNSAFKQCNTLQAIIIPQSVTKIDHFAFTDCTNLTAINFPSGVTEIGNLAFSNCQSLESVVLPNSLTKIGTQAFYCCNSVSSVTIPQSVTTISDIAFGFCASLAEFKGKFASEDGRCLVVDGTLNSFASAGVTEYSIPSSVTAIGHYAMHNSALLTTVTIPQSVQTVGDGAFNGCISLASVYCKPTTPPTGGSAMFDNNAANRKIYVPAGSVEAYKTAAGWSNYADAIVTEDVEQLTIEQFVTKEVGDVWYQLVGKVKDITNATYGNFTLVDDTSSVYVYGLTATKTDTNDQSFQSLGLREGDVVTLIGRRAEYNGIPQVSGAYYVSHESVTSYQILYTSTDGEIVTPYATDVFGATIVSNTYENGQGVITFDSVVTSVGNYAFYKCRNLTSVTIPNGVTLIGNNAFDECSISSIIIPDGVESIGTDAFIYCHNLTEVHIPQNVITLGGNPFRSCNGLAKFSGKYASADGRLLVQNGNIYSFAQAGLVEYTITEPGVNTIGWELFRDCESLVEVTIPQTITEIDFEAFYNCSNLKSVYCRSTTPPILGSKAFGGNATDRKIYVPASSVEAYKSAQYWSEYADSIVAEGSDSGVTPGGDIDEDEYTDEL